MLQSSFTIREQIIETVHQLFNLTDAKDWAGLRAQVFAPSVEVDMTSMGMPAIQQMAVDELCAMWQQGLADIDAVFHLAGNHTVQIGQQEAYVYCYASATHFKQSATQGNTRTFNGTYNLHLVETPQGWRLDRFKFNLLYIQGNEGLQ
jgi:hypothetical protein